MQAVPAALGALLARSQFGGDRPREEREAFAGYGGTLFMMLVGALFLGLNVAPTEEMVQIAYTMTPWHALGLLALTVGDDARLRLRPRRPATATRRGGA